MSELIKILPWDSDFFGLRIGRVDILIADDWRSLQNMLLGPIPFDLLYVFDYFDKTKNVTLIGDARFVDTKVVYGKTLLPSPREHSPNVHFYDESLPDRDLYSLALISGQFSRYKLDSRFPKGSYERLYRKWIENSVNGTLADVVLYYSDAISKKGMVTVCQNEEHASIGLIAVDPVSQGQGIGTELVMAAEQWLMLRGVKLLEVATQKNNIFGCHFYEKIGFRRISETNIYHIWL